MKHHLKSVFYFLWSQEVNRLIRDNDRLHRIIVRNGGADQFRNVPSIPDHEMQVHNGLLDKSMNNSFFNAAQSPG